MKINVSTENKKNMPNKIVNLICRYKWTCYKNKD